MLLRTVYVAAFLFVACAALPLHSDAMQRRGSVPRGNQERRSLVARPTGILPSNTCTAMVESAMDIGEAELIKGRAGSGSTWVELSAVTGYRTLGPESGHVHQQRRPRVGVVAINASGLDRITLAVMAPPLLRGGGAAIPFTGEWAWSDQRTRGYVGVVGTEREITLPPSGRIYVRLGGRITYGPGELPTPKQRSGEEYAAEWVVHVSGGVDVGARARVPDCLHRAAVLATVLLRQPASACTVTASPAALDFGTVRRTREPPLTGYRHEHSVTVDETKTPAEVSLTDASGDHFDGAPSGQRGWMSILAGVQGAFVLPSFPGTIDHTAPPADLAAGRITAIPYAPTWAYHVGPSDTGDDFASLASCTPPCSPSSHQVPAGETHEVAFGGTISIDRDSGMNVDFVAVPGSYSGAVEVTIACN